MLVGLGLPTFTIVIGAVGVALFHLSVENEIREDLARLESRVTKKIQDKQDVFLSSLILTLQARGHEMHPLAKKAAKAGSVMREGGKGYQGKWPVR